MHYLRGFRQRIYSLQEGPVGFKSRFLSPSPTTAIALHPLLRDRSTSKDILKAVAAEGVINPLQFPLFPCLPRELRDEIWRNALPQRLEPGLYFYKPRCWCSQRLTPLGENCDCTRHESPSNLKYCHDLLDNHEFEIALYFVNHEARAVTLAWARKLKMQVRSNSQPATFVWPFTPNRDVMYCPTATHLDWQYLIGRLDMIHWEPGLFGEPTDVKLADVTSIAVPKVLIEDFRSASFIAARLVSTILFFMSLLED